MNPVLKDRLIAGAVGGAYGLAFALIAYFESTNFERRAYTPYTDVAGVLTVCDGITGQGVVAGKTYTDAECDGLLKDRIAVAIEDVRACIHVPLNAPQEASLINFAFQFGRGKLCASTAAAYLNQKDYERGCKEMARWRLVRGVSYEGLRVRANTNYNLCFYGMEFSQWH